jgi:hypothetical protein
MQSETLAMDERLIRRMGRASRVQSVAIRFTKDEEATLARVAKARGITIREWAREVLLRESQPVDTSAAVITELVALRMLLSTVLRTVALGEKLTPEAYGQVLAEVRKGKREATRDVLSQYTIPTREQ